MDTKNNTQIGLRERLIAFVVVLAVGFAMGWFNNQPATDTIGTSGIIAADTQTESSSDSNVSSQEGTQEHQENKSPASGQSNSTQSTPQSSNNTQDDSGSESVAPARGPTVKEDGRYTSKDEVALYIHTYKHLPSNFISKTKARARGWVASEGNLDEVCPGMSIGGSRFYNDDGKLPDERRRQWTECDINYHGGYRGSERIVFSNDGLIFYTADHYETFERLY